MSVLSSTFKSMLCLRYLSLQDCHLDNDAVKELADALVEHPVIETLDLSRTTTGGQSIGPPGKHEMNALHLRSSRNALKALMRLLSEAAENGKPRCVVLYGCMLDNNKGEPRFAAHSWVWHLTQALPKPEPKP